MLVSDGQLRRSKDKRQDTYRQLQDQIRAKQREKQTFRSKRKIDRSAGTRSRPAQEAEGVDASRYEEETRLACVQASE